MSESRRRVTVLFDTDEYRGDHSADVTITRLFGPEEPISKLLLAAVEYSTTAGRRATIRTVPEVAPACDLPDTDPDLPTFEPEGGEGC